MNYSIVLDKNKDAAQKGRHLSSIFTGTQDEGQVYELRKAGTPRHCPFHRIQDQQKDNPACQWDAEVNAYECFQVPRAHRDEIHENKEKCS